MARKKFNTSNYDRAVYNILNRQFVTGGEPLTRKDIEKEIGKSFRPHQWNSIMKSVRYMVEQNDLTVPKATAEGGFKYEITDDPNPVFPGMLHSMRQQSGLRDGIFKARRFIGQREDSIDKRLNGRALEAADIILEQEELLERMISLTNATFADVLSERKQVRDQDLFGEDTRDIA